MDIPCQSCYLYDTCKAGETCDACSGSNGEYTVMILDADTDQDALVDRIWELSDAGKQIRLICTVRPNRDVLYAISALDRQILQLNIDLSAQSSLWQKWLGIVLDLANKCGVYVCILVTVVAPGVVLARKIIDLMARTQGYGRVGIMLRLLEFPDGVESPAVNGQPVDMSKMTLTDGVWKCSAEYSGQLLRLLCAYATPNRIQIGVCGLHPCTL